MATKYQNNETTETAFFGAGCFWHIEEEFSKLEGVKETKVGYMGGKTGNPTYEEVCSNTTGHIETTKVIFNPEEISYKELLDKFWHIHNPTSKDAQGPDIGKQYRSVIFCTTEKQRTEARQSKAQAQKLFSNPIVTEIQNAKIFYLAEEYHQHYVKKHGVDTCRI